MKYPTDPASVNPSSSRFVSIPLTVAKSGTKGGTLSQNYAKINRAPAPENPLFYQFF